MEDLPLKTSIQELLLFESWEKHIEIQATQKPIQQKDFPFVFKPPFLTKPERTFCEICCRFLDKGEYASDESLRMLICYGCNASVHLSCHGPSTLYNTERSLELSREDHMFVCTRCREKGPDFQPSCILCAKKAGLMKHYSFSSQLSSDWVHPLCALFSNAFELIDPDEMLFELHATKDLGRRAAKKQTCDLCLGSQGTLFGCSHENCKKNIHYFCGIWEKANNLVISQDLDAENLVEENPAEWGIRVLLQKNPAFSQKLAANRENPLTKHELEKLYSEFKEIERSFCRNTEVSSSIPKKKEKNKKKLASSIEESLDLDEGFHEFLQSLEEKNLRDAPNDSSQSEDFSNLRGASLVFQCPEHKVPEVYCVCEPKSFLENSEMMIACDYCDNWFHFSCVGLANKNKEPNFAEIPYYLCFQCQEWLKFKAKLLRNDENLRSNAEKPLRNLVNFELFPKNPSFSRFRLADLLLIYRVLLHKLEKMLRNPAENALLEEFSQQFLETAAMLPYKLPRRFEELKKIKHLAAAVSVLSQKFASKVLENAPVRSCFCENGEFSHEKHAESLEIAQKIKRIEEFFLRNGVCLRETLRETYKNVEILQWILEFHRIFSTFPGEKPDLQKLARLQSQAAEFREQDVGEFAEIARFKAKMREFEEKKQLILAKLRLEKPNSAEFSEKNSAEFSEKNSTELSKKNSAEFFKKNSAEVSKKPQEFLQFLDETFRKHSEIFEKRLDFAELEALEAEIRSLEFDWPAFLETLRGEREKVQQWRRKFKEIAGFRGADLENFVREADEMLTKVPEMFEVLQLLRSFKLWTQEFEELSQKLRESRVRPQELEELLQKREKSLDFEEKAAFLQEKLAEFEDFRRKLQVLLRKPMDISQWNRLKKESAGVFQQAELEEAREFETKLRVFKEISGFLGQHKRISLEKLQELREKASNLQLEPKLVRELDAKIEKAGDLLEKTRGILQRSEFEFADSQEISNLLLEIKSNRLDFCENASLKAVLDSFELLEKLRRVFAENCEDCAETREILEKPAKNVKILAAELMKVEKLQEKLPVIYAELKSLVAELARIGVLDASVRELLQKYQTFLWNYEANQLFSLRNGQLISSEDLENLHKDCENLAISAENRDKVRELFAKYQETRAKVAEKLDFLEKSLAQASDLQNFAEVFEEIDAELANCGFSLRELSQKTQFLRSWGDWLQRACELRGLMRENREIDYESSKKLLVLGEKIGFPQENAVFCELQRVFSAAGAHKASISAYFLAKRKALELLKTAKIENASRKRFFELNRTKPQRKVLENLLQDLEVSVNDFTALYSLLKAEAVELESDALQTREFLRKYEAFSKNFSLESAETLRNLSNNEFEVLKTEISNYRQEFLWNIPVYDADWDRDFSRMEMKFHGFSILAGNISANLVFVRNYLKFAEDLKDEQLVSADFFKTLKQIFVQAKEINQKIEEIKAVKEQLQEDAFLRKDLISEKTLENLLESARSSPVNLGENRSFLESLAAKYRKTKEFCEKSQLFLGVSQEKSAKVSHLEFSRLFEEVKQLPLEFAGYEFLEKQAGLYENLQRFLEKTRKFLQMEQIPAQIAELLLQKYAECRIFINEYEKLAEKFAKSSGLMEELERKLALFDDFLQQRLEEHQELSKKFDSICIDFGERTLNVRVLLFKQRVQFLQEMREKSAISKESLAGIPQKSCGFYKVSFKQLQHDLQYGYSLLVTDEIVEKLRLQILWLESLLQEVAEKLLEIGKIKNVTVLEDYAPTFLEFIDISEEIIEYKMALSYEKDAKISIDLGIRRFFQHYKEGIDCTKLLKSLGVTPVTRGLVDPHEISRVFAEEKPHLAEEKSKKFAFLREMREKERKEGETRETREKLRENREKLRENREKFSENRQKHKEKHAILGKRKSNPTSFGNEFITNFSAESEESDSFSEKTSKKVKKEGGVAKDSKEFKEKAKEFQEKAKEFQEKGKETTSQAQKPSLLKPLSLKESQLSQKEARIRIVSSEKREELLDKLEKLVKANAKFRKTSKNLKTFLQILENQIFGTHHSSPQKYDSEGGLLAKVFEKLLKFPYISSNILAKNFRVEMMQKLTKNLERLPQIEANLKSKDQTAKPPAKTTAEKSNNPYKPLKLPLEKPLEKKLKVEQYDPFEKNLMKKQQTPPNPLRKDDDPLKQLFAIKGKPQNSSVSQENLKKPLGLLVLTEKKPAVSASFEKKPEKPAKAELLYKKTKRNPLEGYEALSSDDEKPAAKAENRGVSSKNSKKEEKKLEFSDEEEDYKEKPLRKKQETSEDSLDNLSRGSAAYDPLTENKKLEPDQAILFDPDNEESQGNAEKTLKRTAPKGSLLKIFEGRFRLNHSLAVSAQFLSIEEIGVIAGNFPKIVLKEKSSLKVSGTTDFKTFSDFYFGPSGYKNKRVVVAGWVHASSEKHAQALESYADELFRSNKIGGCKFGKENTASFHFFSTKQLRNDTNLKDFEFKIRNKQQSSSPALVFFLTTKQGALRSSESALEPEILEVFSEMHAEEIENLNKREEFEKHDVLASPLTNEEKSEDLEKDERNDEDIEEIIKKMDSNKQAAELFEDKPFVPTKVLLEQANIQAEELTPVKEGEEEEKSPLIASTIQEQYFKSSQEMELTGIIQELQKMRPEELKEFVASFEPECRGKIASLIKEFSQEENTSARSNEIGFENPNQNQNQTPNQTPNQQAPMNNNPNFFMYQQPTFYGNVAGFPQQQQQPQGGGGGYSRPPGKMYPGMRQGNMYSNNNHNRFAGNKMMYGQFPPQQMQNPANSNVGVGGFGYNMMEGAPQGMNRNVQGFRGSNNMMATGNLNMPGGAGMQHNNAPTTQKQQNNNENQA